MGRLLDRVNKKIEERKTQSPTLYTTTITNLTLAEFSRRNIAIEIYSEVLKCTLWLCSDEAMKAQVMRDAPGKVCYTALELRNLLKLNPSPEDLKKIHEAIEVFPKSTLCSAKKAK